MRAGLCERLLWTTYLGFHWRGQARFPYTSANAIARAQSRRVRRMVAHAYRTVPYYRETMKRLGLRPGDIRTAADLERLPIVERADLQRDPQSFESAASRRGRDLVASSGGSTGAPRRVKWDTAAIFQNAGHSERERSIIAAAVGRFTHYRESVIASPFGSESDVQSLYAERAALPRRLVQYQRLSLLDSPEANLPLLNRFKPDVIRSYGSYLARLFEYVCRSGVEFHVPAVVFYDADELPEPARRLIADTFGVTVLSAYQAVEAFKIGFECEQHSGLHLNIDLYPVRIVDRSGRETRTGDSGEVIVSNLVNRATVLLNYRLGDLATIFAHACPCGRRLPLMSFIEGRSDDWVVLPSGEAIHPQSVRTLFTHEHRITQYQVVQMRPDRFSVRLAGVAPSDEIADSVRRSFAARFGPSVEADVAFVDAIEPSAAGKIRPVISKLTSGEVKS